LAQVLDDVPDPRRVRGRRYRSGSLLALCTIAVLSGAKSVSAIARFTADGNSELRRPRLLSGLMSVVGSAG
jgi:hypothetical protein